MLAAIMQTDLGPDLNAFAQHAFGPFDFAGLEPRLPTQTFDGLIELDARTLVPGHGPVTDNDGVRAVKGYLEYIGAEARKRFEAGMDARDAADDIELGRYADLGDAERIVQNVEQAYRELDPSRPAVSRIEIFGAMAAWRKRHGRL